jgi:adenosine deaminase
MTSWQSLPKVELHVHLDCALSFESVARLAPELERAAYEAAFCAPEVCRSLPELIAPAVRAVALLQDEAALRLAARDLADQLAADHVVYAEVRFAPLLHLEAGLSPDDVVTIVGDELRAAASARGVEARLLLCALRHFSPEKSLATARLAIAHAASGVVGLDLAGDEGGHPLEAHVAAFALAREHGLACTAHAGEGAGPASVADTLERLRPARIGHGVRSAEDAEVVARLRDRGVHLEVCPTSNVQVGLYADIAAHPLQALRAQGVSVGINTDGRTLSRLTLSREYERVAAAFGWTPRDFETCNLAALDAAFAPADVKARARQRLLAASASPKAARPA